MPKFKQIFLSKTSNISDSNDIVSIKAFNKCFWPEFSYLSLRNLCLQVDRNKVQEGRLDKMMSSSINTINIEYDGESQRQCFEYRWLGKIKSSELKSLSKRLENVALKNQKRIEQKEVKRVLSKRFSNISF